MEGVFGEVDVAGEGAIGRLPFAATVIILQLERCISHRR